MDLAGREKPSRVLIGRNPWSVPSGLRVGAAHLFRPFTVTRERIDGLDVEQDGAQGVAAKSVSLDAFD